MSRNSSGTYSPPAGNPVVTGTIISSTVENANVSDIGTEITDSLSRSGKGGMLAPLRSTDGTVFIPQYSFTSDTNTGVYRAGTDDVRMAAGGIDVQGWTPTANTLYQPAWNKDGTVGAPSISFSADTDTGFYRVSSNDFAAVVGGAGVVEYQSDGLKMLPANPVSTAAFTNKITAKNTVKAWAVVFTAGGGSATATVQAGFNIASASATTGIVITFASAFSSAVFSAVAQVIQSTADISGTRVTLDSATQVTFTAYDSAGVAIDLKNTQTSISLMAIGAQ